MIGMYSYLSARLAGDEGTEMESVDGMILESLYKTDKASRSRYSSFLVAFIAMWTFMFIFSLNIYNNFETVVAMLRLLIVCISGGTFCFFISRFIVNNMIFHQLALMNRFSGNASSEKNALTEFLSSQLKFTKSVIIFPLLPIIYGTAFFIIFRSLSV